MAIFVNPEKLLPMKMAKKLLAGYSFSVGVSNYIRIFSPSTIIPSQNDGTGDEVNPESWIPFV